jgi:putative endopeptidase
MRPAAAIGMDPDAPRTPKKTNDMKKILILASMIGMTACQNNPKTPAIDPTNMDLTVAPADDFYQYATGGWQAKNSLKPEFSRYGSFDVLRENNQKRINDLFAEMAAKEAAPGSVEQKIADLYRMGLDSTRLNAEGAAPIEGAVGEILAIADRGQLAPAIATLHRSVGNPFFAVGVEADLMDSDTNALYIAQDGLGMGDRDYYLEASNEHIRTAYKNYLATIFRLAGLPEAEIERAVASVMRIETQLAEKAWSNVELRDIPAMYNPMTKAEFEQTYDGIDWEAYFRTIGVGDFDRIIVSTPSSVANAVELLRDAPLEELRYYLAAQYINAAASYLSDDFQEASFDFFGRTMAGQQEMKPRWKRAMSVPNGTLAEAVGKLYVAEYFPEKDKERMLVLVDNLRKALAQHIDALDWMSDETKARAQEKLDSFTVKIGYPDTWKDYTTLAIDPAKSYWENIRNASEWYTADNLAQLGKPVDRAKWHMSPQTVNAYYNPTTNEICFPAAILQPPFYNPDADDAVNYGAIGVVIGHEMTHGFDDQGRRFDKEGNMNNWWTEADAEAFKAKTDILVGQFDAIEVLPAQGDRPALMANGSLSLGENIADQGGLRVARTALRNALGGDEPAPIDGFTAAQRFYLAYATLWGQNIRDEEIARLTKLDVHSLGKWRVNATLRNLQDFYDAFGIAGGPMFLPVEERVIIW